MSTYETVSRALHRAVRWHPLAVARVRVAVGIWLLVLSAILYSSSHSGWVLLLILTAALHFAVAARQFQIAKEPRDPAMRVQ